MLKRGRHFLVLGGDDARIAIGVLFAKEIEAKKTEHYTKPDCYTCNHAAPERVLFLFIFRRLRTRAIFVKLWWHWNTILFGLKLKLSLGIFLNNLLKFNFLFNLLAVEIIVVTMWTIRETWNGTDPIDQWLAEVLLQKGE